MLATLTPPTANELLLRLVAANGATAGRRNNAATHLTILFVMPFVFSFAIVANALWAMAGGAAFHSYYGASALLLLLPVAITPASRWESEPESISTCAIAMSGGAAFSFAIIQVCDYSPVFATVLVVCFVYENQENSRAADDLAADAINVPMVAVLAVMAFGSPTSSQCAHVDEANERCSQRTAKGAPTCGAHA